MTVARRITRLARSVGASLLVALIAACSFTGSSDDGIDYRSQARKAPQLDVPPDLVSPRSDERFAVIPGTEEKTFSAFQKGRAERVPSQQAVLPQAGGARIERAGGQRWLVVGQPPDKVWPALREFWQESGFVIATESPEVGIIETEWAENRAKIPQDIIRRTVGRVFDSLYATGERDKFRTRIEAGSGGTEIYVSHRGMTEVARSATPGPVADSTVWQPRASDPELEAEFLRRIQLKLSGVEAAKPATATVANAPAAASDQSVQLVGSPGAEQVRVAESFDRAWRRVGLALDRGGFTVEDRDRSQGVYFVRYIDPEAEAAAASPGFFSRVFGGKKAEPSKQFRIRLTGESDTTLVGVQTRDGQPVSGDADQKTAGRILALLRDQLKP